MTTSRLLTAADVADLLQVGRSTIYEWSRRGDLPCVVLRRGRGRAVRRWAPSDVEAFIRAGRSGGADLDSSREPSLCMEASGRFPAGARKRGRR